MTGLAGGDVPAEGERGGDHGFHLVQIGQHFGALLVVLHVFGAQLEAGDRRAQIVADGGEEEGTVRDKTADARGHGVEGGGGGDDFDWGRFRAKPGR